MLDHCAEASDFRSYRCGRRRWPGEDLPSPIEVAPPPCHFDVRLVHRPRAAGTAPPLRLQAGGEQGAKRFSQPRTVSWVAVQPRMRAISATWRRLSVSWKRPNHDQDGTVGGRLRMVERQAGALVAGPAAHAALEHALSQASCRRTSSVVAAAQEGYGTVLLCTHSSGLLVQGYCNGRLPCSPCPNT